MQIKSDIGFSEQNLLLMVIKSIPMNLNFDIMLGTWNWYTLLKLENNSIRILGFITNHVFASFVTQFQSKGLDAHRDFS